MEKRNKKKLFAIIGGSVLAFVLTIALSVSITLAYFGDVLTSNSLAMTLGEKLEFTQDTVTASVTGASNLEGMLPGESRTVSITGEVVKSTTEYFLRFKLEAKAAEGQTATATVGDVTITGIDTTKAEAKLHTDGYYYIVAKTGQDNAGNPLSIATGNDNDSYTVTVEVGVPTSVTNETADDFVAVTVSGEMGIIQSQFLGATSLADVATAWSTAAI